MELKCYEVETNRVKVEPARLKRDWMDETPDGHAYRCLPLTRANSHGWELLCPIGFEAVWDGGPTTDALKISIDSSEEDDGEEQNLVDTETSDEKPKPSSANPVIEKLLAALDDSIPTLPGQEGQIVAPPVPEKTEPNPHSLAGQGAELIDLTQPKISGLVSQLAPSLAPKGAHMIESHFGNGILTFNPALIFRTAPGYDLWVSGPTNQFKDGIQATQAIVETDWMPFTFTANWKFTRPNVPIRFEKNEPFCFFFPIERGTVKACDPVIASLESDPALKEVYWNTRLKRNATSMFSDNPKELFQGWYMKGTHPVTEKPGAETHQLATRSNVFKREDS